MIDDFDFFSTSGEKGMIEEDEVRELVPIDVLFRGGGAGCGKTYKTRKELAENPAYKNMRMCATTGIAALNLGEGVTTLHSTLRFFDFNSALEHFTDGVMTRRIKYLMTEEGCTGLAIDEVSMLPGRLLDLIYNSAMEASNELGMPFNLICIGDFCQLPPVSKDKSQPIDWLFRANCWPEFDKNKEIMTVNYRQSNPIFLEALLAARRGDGKGCVERLRDLPVTWKTSLDNEFNGTTIVASNEKKDEYNRRKFQALPGQPFEIKSFRWAGTDDPKSILKQWQDIPPTMLLKEKALIMIKVNDTKGWTYANGSLAWVRGMNKERQTLQLELIKDQIDIELPITIRQHLTKVIPDRWKKRDQEEWPRSRNAGKLMADPSNPNDWSYFDQEKGKWCVGEVIYFAIDYAWATTVHKSQGLTLDNVQINIGEWFFGQPAMAYVALSRVKTPEGMTIVGTPSTLASKCNVSKEVIPWL